MDSTKQAAPGQSSGKAAAGGGRVVSVDALRGFDMFWIIGGRGVFIALFGLLVGLLAYCGVDLELVEGQLASWGMPIELNPEWLANHEQMRHPSWIGFSVWDMIMPLFLFIVGTAMPFSFARRIELGQSKMSMYRKIITRTLILFVLGMAAQGSLLKYNRDELQIFCNTLQAIACGYFVAAIVMLNARAVVQLLVAAALLVGYWALMMFVPIPGQEQAGILRPDLNLALHIDQSILRPYFNEKTTYTWILSSMGFSATVLLGVMSGHLLRSGRHPLMKVFWLVMSGIACLGLGWIWHTGQIGAPNAPLVELPIIKFPIIKHIWSSSMVLWSAGWCFFLLALFYLIIDVMGLRKWAFFFVVIGMNPISVYMATHLFDFRKIGDVFVGNLAPKFIDPYGDYLRTLAAFAVVWLILLYMYRKKTFIRV